ncbi:MAG: zinc ribbon domain-containing protein [Ruminococcaceae bacterium]|nr:zinc ribbon domain-containing protein [Oscillospiraceae bacterium]
MFCPNCGNEIKNGETACSNCGNIVAAAPQATSRLKSTFGGGKRTTGIGMTPFRETELSPPGTYNPVSETPAPTPTYSDLRGPEITPSSAYAPTSMDMGSTAGGGYSPVEPTRDSEATGYAEKPEPTPTSTTYDYSEPREYIPAPTTTDNTKMIKILVAVALLVSVWLLPLISVQQYNTKIETSGIKYMGEFFKTIESLPDILENFDVLIDYYGAVAVASLLEPFVFLLYAFSSIGVFFGALSGKKSGGKAATVLGIIGAVLWLVARIIMVNEAFDNMSVTDFVGYGFWVSCGLYITSAVLASKE